MAISTPLYRIGRISRGWALNQQGPLRDRLGIVTRAYFAQRDFIETGILIDFYDSLNAGFQGKTDEVAITMGQLGLRGS